MACETPNRGHHALAVSLPGQGHVNPLMRFCKKLAARVGFIITFVEVDNTYFRSDEQQRPLEPLHHHHESQLPQLVLDEAEGPDGGLRQVLDIRRTRISVPDVAAAAAGAGVMECFFTALNSLTPQIEQLLLQKQEPPITCIISDLFITGPTQCVADKFNLPRIAFYPCSQSILLLVNYIHEGVMPLEEVIKVVEAKERLRDDIFREGLPGLPTIKVRDLIDHVTENRFVYTFGLQLLQETKKKAHAIVVNSCKELEDDALKVNIGIPIYSIGILAESLNEEINTSFWKEDEACMLWLDSQPRASVLYISFGSSVSLTLPQFEEFVAGLLSSHQPFLWVFRPNLVKDAPYATFPEELLSTSHGKAYATNWAPQIKVLSHPSIHGFLTHCGWNSTVEAIIHGVPMLCFPHFGDQFLNAKLIIEKWQIGVGFKENKENGLISREEIERVIQRLLHTQEGERLRTNSKYLKEACAQSYLPNSQAFNNLQSLVRSLK